MMLFPFANVCKREVKAVFLWFCFVLFDVLLENFCNYFHFSSGGEEEPGDFCEQAPEQDQPGGDWVGVPVLGRGESISDWHTDNLKIWPHRLWSGCQQLVNRYHLSLYHAWFRSISVCFLAYWRVTLSPSTISISPLRLQMNTPLSQHWLNTIRKLEGKKRKNCSVNISFDLDYLGYLYTPSPWHKTLHIKLRIPCPNWMWSK